MPPKLKLQESIFQRHLPCRKSIRSEGPGDLGQLRCTRRPWVQLLQKFGAGDGAAQNALQPIDIQIRCMQCKYAGARWPHSRTRYLPANASIERNVRIRSRQPIPFHSGVSQIHLTGCYLDRARERAELQGRVVNLHGTGPLRRNKPRSWRRRRIRWVAGNSCHQGSRIGLRQPIGFQRQCHLRHTADGMDSAGEDRRIHRARYLAQIPQIRRAVNVKRKARRGQRASQSHRSYRSQRNMYRCQIPGSGRLLLDGGRTVSANGRCQTFPCWSFDRTNRSIGSGNQQRGEMHRMFDMGQVQRQRSGTQLSRARTQRIKSAPFTFRVSIHFARCSCVSGDARMHVA